LAPEIVKRLEDYESGRCQQLEKIEELSQAVARLTAENKSTRVWLESQLKLLWDHTSRNDEMVGAARKVGDQAVATSSMPTTLQAVATSSMPTTPQAVATSSMPTTLPATTPTPLQMREVIEIGSPVASPIADTTDVIIVERSIGTPKFKKRPASESGPGDSKKRRKLGGI
jgi:hypothetical protein